MKRKRFEKLMISLRPGMTMERDFLLKRLIEIRYERNDVAFERNRFRVRGDTVELYPAYYRDKAVRVEFFGDEIDRISEFNPVNGQVTRTLQHIAIYPASHYVTTKDKLERAIVEIDKELDEREAQFLAEGKAVEAQRIRQRTRYDIEMLRELGYCTGIENYSRVISGRPVGSPPLTLIDYFPKDFLLFVDESHVTLPQVRAMYNGDRARKESLVEYGFRLPAARDNRPLTFDEFEALTPQTIYVSATPADYELVRSEGIVVDQVIRPTGLLDPPIEVRPTHNQIDDLMEEIQLRIERGERTLVTTLTKRMAEELTEFLLNHGGRCNYILVRFGFVGVSRRDLFLNQCECNGIAHFAIGKGNALNAINGYDVSLLYGIALDDVLHGLTCFCCSRFFHVGGGICDSFVYDFDRMLLLSCADAAVDVGGDWSEGNFDRHPVGSPVDRPCTVWALLALELVDFVADRDPFDDPVHHILEQSGHLGTAGETNASAKLARFVDPHLDRATDLAVHRVRIMTVQKRKPLICAVHSNGGCFADQHFVVVFVPAEARNHFFGRANDIYLAGLLVDGRRLHERPPVQHAHGAVIRFLFCHCYFLFGRP